MKKYTANYIHTNSNFVIQNLKDRRTEDTELYAFCCVLKNILQRGVPTRMSKFLQEKLGKIHEKENFTNYFLYPNSEKVVWHSTIKGDEQRNNFPARRFYEEIILKEFGEYAFVQSLIVPEIEINEICGHNEGFKNQQVDFYLPQAKLVIEIDGRHHEEERQKKLDTERDNYLKGKGIRTIRITTDELDKKTYTDKINEILNHLGVYKKLLNKYKSAYSIDNNDITKEILNEKYLPTAIIRFQILILELLMNGQLKLDTDWNFNIFTEVNLNNFAELAIEDIFIWFEHLYLLKNKQSFKKPKFSINFTEKESEFKTDCININFSLSKRYTDENLLYPETIFVRTDYFDRICDKNYFQVSTSQPINYEVTKDDEKTIEFFLQNIFDKPNLREGQFPIIANALNRKDTIGLLPTGGGKSLCYQLPCLLQPSINFVVCPIKSLMYDQKENLDNILITKTNWITSDLTPEEKSEVEQNFEQGKYLLTWISPERFQIQSFRDKIQNINANFSIAYAVIDEVHCLSEWGHSFRLSYLNLAKTIDKLSPKDENGEGVIKFLGLTATASVNVLKDIKIEFSRQKTRLEDENIKSLTDYSRKELEFQVIKDKKDKAEELKTLLEQFKNEDGFLENDERAGLIFTPNVNGYKGCYTLSNHLSTIYPNKVSWYAGSIPNDKTYHTVKIPEQYAHNHLALINEIKRQLKEFDNTLSEEEIDTIIRNNGDINQIQSRASKNNGVYLLSIKQIPKFSEKKFKDHKDEVQKAFKQNKYSLLVATKSFGMGIDKDNIFYTIHYGISSSVESLYQEAGRAGRWAKIPENEHKKGRCFVLFSPETLSPSQTNKVIDEQDIDLNDLYQTDANDYLSEVFAQNTTIKRIKEITEAVEKNDQKDVSSQLFLFLQGLKDVDDDLKAVLDFKNRYFKKNKTKTITFFGTKGRENQEKIIYRLSLLGIVKDWTNNFVNQFEVTFSSDEDSHILKSIENYVGKYELTKNIANEIEKTEGSSFLEKSTRYLLQWIFDHIVYNRKQSLKTLYDWCLEFKDSASFKKQLDSYFVFSDLTFILQALGEKPLDYKNWFDVFYFEEETNESINGQLKKNKIFIPTLKDKMLRNDKYRNLRDVISRFLESYKNNVGLDFVSGLVRLALDDFKNLDGKPRFENALKMITTEFSKENQQEILDKLMSLGKHFETHQKERICISIKKYFSEQVFVSFADEFHLPYLLVDLYQQRIEKLKQINNQLYEQLREI
ncbi:DEAD/DEAH box helicase [Capnocytophaga canimorsus]|uniref:DEAD/DEAH box helicase n=1 Tax=Capnocytophaga canimorsus TaxID=28188 RepID=UPI00384B2ACF